MAAACVNSIGLVFDIVGVVLIWKFGLPETLNRRGEQRLVTEQIDENEKRKAASYDRYSRIGLGLLVLGFFLQLVSNWL